MNFENSIKEGYVKLIPINTIRAKSLIKQSDQAIETASKIDLSEMSKSTILREFYEGLRQFCEAIGYIKGYKFDSHETITYFLRDILKESPIATKFDRYRLIRNRINYYGDDISIETISHAVKDIPEIIQELKKHTKSLFR